MSNPLREVFGFPTTDTTPEATRHRNERLCPHKNGAPCTKDKADDPLGVCTVNHGNAGTIATTCPVRFREDELIARDAADFFFPPGSSWTCLPEVRLKDVNGGPAGNIDLVLVAHDDQGTITDFGSVEIQAVYISGNIRRPFEQYMTNPVANGNLNWSGQSLYPRADFLSSSRKRLVPQLMYKGGILHTWGKKQAVVLDEAFFGTLPVLTPVPQAEADLVWLVYKYVAVAPHGRLTLTPAQRVYTKFEDAMVTVSKTVAGPVEDFVSVLQSKLSALPPTSGLA